MNYHGMMVGDSGMEESKVYAPESILSHNVDDIIFQILLRLPSKSLMRFKSVCKSWLSLIGSRYFCSLWQQHRYVLLSGPKAGVPRFELPSHVHYVVKSYNGFLLCYTRSGLNGGRRDFWVYNPATGETFPVPPARLEACKIHSGRCTCRFAVPVLAFDSHSRGRMVALSTHKIEHHQAYMHQVCVSENQGAWTSSSKAFESKPLFWGVLWRNFVVWLNPDTTLFYDVGGEGLRFGDSPPVLKSQLFDYYEGPYSYQHRESGGHLHFFSIHGLSHLIIEEMKPDLSGWFLKHKIELSRIEASLVQSIGWDVNRELKFKINFVMEDEEDPKLVLGCRGDVVIYSIQHHKSWKLCEWNITSGGGHLFPLMYFHKRFAHQHLENISRFHGHHH